MRLIQVFLAVFSLTAEPVGAASVPNEFQPNTPALASEVNANFQALVDAVNAQQNAIDQLQDELATANATIAQLQTDLSSAEATIAQLESDLVTAEADIFSNGSAIADIQSNTVLALDGFLTRETDFNGYETARFDSINVQITNGTGATNGDSLLSPFLRGPVNGLGNLVIGYNEEVAGASPFCSDPAYVSQTTCESNGGTWGLWLRTGSHNLVIGPGHGYSSHGGLLAGIANIVNGHWGSVSGGWLNVASGAYGAVSGGENNTASGESSSVSGGFNRDAVGEDDWVAGSQFEDQ